MKEAIAEVGRSDELWTVEQKRALKAALQAIADNIDGALLLRGQRVKRTVTLDSDDAFFVECTFRPSVVLLLRATDTAANVSVGNYPIQWRWDGSRSVYIVAPDLSGTFDVDVFIERA